MENENKLTNLTGLLEEKGSVLSLIIKDYERVLRLKAETNIVVLSDPGPSGKGSGSSGEILAAYLGRKGFQKVTNRVPKGEGDIRVEADLIIFHRSSITIKHQYVSDEYVKKYIKTHWKDQAQLYFGPYNHNLDTRVDQVVFANYPQKLAGNIIEMLIDREEERIQPG